MIFRRTIKPRDKEDGGKMNDYLQNLHVSIDLPHLRLQMIAMLQEKQITKLYGAEFKLLSPKDETVSNDKFVSNYKGQGDKDFDDEEIPF